jgi:hypothetical protein
LSTIIATSAIITASSAIITASSAIIAASSAIIAASSAIIAASSATTTTASISLLTISEDLTDLEMICRDRLRKEERFAVIKAHAVLPCVAGEDCDNCVLGRSSTSHLFGVIFARSEMEEASTTSV